MLEQLERQLKQMERVVEDIEVNIKQVWKRIDDGLLVQVSGLIFQEPNRVMWRALPAQDNPSAYGTVTETEFKEQFEYQFPKESYQADTAQITTTKETRRASGIDRKSVV